MMDIIEADDGRRVRIAIERCAEQIARALGGRMLLEQRIELERAIDALVREIEDVCGCQIWR